MPARRKKVARNVVRKKFINLHTMSTFIFFALSNLIISFQTWALGSLIILSFIGFVAGVISLRKWRKRKALRRTYERLNGRL